MGKFYILLKEDFFILGLFDNLEEPHEIIEELFTDVFYTIRELQLNEGYDDGDIIEEGYGKSERIEKEYGYRG